MFPRNKTQNWTFYKLYSVKWNYKFKNQIYNPWGLQKCNFHHVTCNNKRNMKAQRGYITIIIASINLPNFP